MPEVPKDALLLIYYLLPGFVTAWLLYGLTAYSKAGPFERIVEALIFTITIQAVVIGLRELLFLFGHWGSWGTWTDDCALVVSLGIALIFGLLLARFAHTNTIYRLLCRCGVTRRTCYPSEWFSAFLRQPDWVVLHLKGQRRLYGWPQEWPDHPDMGQFIIDQPEWLLEDGTRAPVHEVRNILVPVSEVEMVEFMCNRAEIKASPNEIEKTHKILVALHAKENANGCQGSTASGGVTSFL
jgi:hypothetical protein